jgi:hypothetical protein
MNTIFHILHLSDLYEVSMRDTTIVRISRYTDDSRRIDLEYDDLLPEVQVKIIAKAKQLLSH